VLADHQLTIGDRVNMVYSGTTIQLGRGRAVVVGTGVHTEFGKIAELLKSTEERKTPLQLALDKLGKTLGLFAVALAAGMSLFGIARGYALVEMFVWGLRSQSLSSPKRCPRS